MADRCPMPIAKSFGGRRTSGEPTGIGPLAGLMERRPDAFLARSASHARFRDRVRRRVGLALRTPDKDGRRIAPAECRMVTRTASQADALRRRGYEVEVGRIDARGGVELRLS
jgi:hypothetical protein